MQPLNQTELQRKIETRMRTMSTLWIAMLLSIGFYFVFTVFLHRPEQVKPNSTLSLILALIALTTTLSSFLLKSRLVSRGAEQQQVSLVQQAYILAWAVTEVAALMGVARFLRNERSLLLRFLSNRSVWTINPLSQTRTCHKRSF